MKSTPQLKNVQNEVHLKEFEQFPHYKQQKHHLNDNRFFNNKVVAALNDCLEHFKIKN